MVATSAVGLEPFLAQVRRSIKTQRKAMDRAINTYVAAAPKDCPLALDTATLGGAVDPRSAARNVLYHRGWRLAFMTAANVGDHMSAVGDVASAEQPRTFAHMTLARAALEGAARIAYLLPAGRPIEDRVLRAAALLLASTEEERRAVGEMATAHPEWYGDAQRAAEDRHDEIRQLMRKAGMEEHRGRGGDRLIGVRWTGSSQEAGCSPNISALLRTLVPDKPAAYRLGSGATHSQAWALDNDSAFDAAARRLRWDFDPSALGGSVDLAITAAKLVIATFAAMLNQDPSSEMVEAQRREEAVTRLTAQLLQRQGAPAAP